MATSSASKLLVPVSIIEQRIYLIRGKKVMLSNDLAELYQVEVRTLVQAVKRNQDRFPADFMFQLNAKEFQNWEAIQACSVRSKMFIERCST